MNLLTDPLLRVRTVQGKEKRLSLPGLLAALGRDEVDSLVGIQRHQEDAFHVFLCQLATAVLVRTGTEDPVQDVDFWLEGLRKLSNNAGDAAWTLVVDDLSLPAFMQPPLPKSDHGKLKPIKPVATAPDALDLLPTAKNHDLKCARVVAPELDNWVYALVSLQTMSGYFGQGNQGISRMNGGHGNRSIVELIRYRRPGGRWQDAVARLLLHREAVLAADYGFNPNGIILVWLKPWDGKSALSLSELDPVYIEICRRVRLRLADDSEIVAESIPASSPRIAAKEARGVVGDAWLPVEEGARGKDAGPKALTVSERGLTPDLLRRMIFEDGIRMSVMHRPLPSWQGAVWLSASVLVRGEGKTDGFHEQHIRIPSRIIPRLFGPAHQRDALALLAKSAIEVSGNMLSRVLRPAVLMLMEGGPEELDPGDSSQAWWTRYARRFESLWSNDYFPWLWSVPDVFNADEELALWARKLRDHALTVLKEAEATTPRRSGRMWRARVQAERVFWRSLFRNFPYLYLKEDVHERLASGGA